MALILVLLRKPDREFELVIVDETIQTLEDAHQWAAENELGEAFELLIYPLRGAGKRSNHAADIANLLVAISKLEGSNGNYYLSKLFGRFSSSAASGDNKKLAAGGPRNK